MHAPQSHPDCRSRGTGLRQTFALQLHYMMSKPNSLIPDPPAAKTNQNKFGLEHS